MSYSEQLLAAIEKHDFSNNRILLKQALDHDQPELLASLADNLTDYGFTDLAKEVYRALIAKFPQEDLFKVYLAEILLNDGDDNDGLSLLFAVKPDSDAYLDSLLIQADYYQTDGLIEVARQKLLQAQKIAPDEDAVKFGLAELDYLSGDYEAALTGYQDLLKRQKQFGEVNLEQRLIACLAKLGDYETAQKEIKAHGDDILDIDAKYQAGLVMLAVGDSQQAIKYLDAVIKQSPDYVNAYPLLAQAYQAADQTELVLETAQTGLNYNELDENLYSLGAAAAIQLNKLSVAQELLEKGVRVLPESSDLRLQLSNLYIRQKQYQKNLELLSKLTDDQLESQDHWNLAISYQYLDQVYKAKSEFLLAYPDFQSNPEFLRQMIFFFKSLAQSQAILQELLQRYLKLVPDDEEMQMLAQELE
jgi:predicted Zn-dependent protease